MNYWLLALFFALAQQSHVSARLYDQIMELIFWKSQKTFQVAEQVLVNLYQGVPVMHNKKQVILFYQDL